MTSGPCASEDSGGARTGEEESGLRTDGRALLLPGRNCWRIEQAGRVACLVDGEEYFAAMRSAVLRARHSVMLLGWDFAEYERLHGGPGSPERLGDFLRDLAARRGALEVRILIWDMSAAIALGRHRLPAAQRIRMNDGRVHYHLDSEHPALATHHQKLLVVDDALAFCGGFDFSGNRWDTRAHAPDDSRRRTPSGWRYEPHHDVMMLVDGAVARSLGELARERWRHATGEALSPIAPGADPWPAEVVPRFRDVAVGISRTAPAWRGRPQVREVEALYFDSIAAARESIYIESQYLASEEIGDALAARLAERDGPEVAVILGRHAPSWIEHVAMDSARARIASRLIAADRFGRFRLVAPRNRGVDIMVHSKVMIVDDRVLRIGSSNISNRSMGLDTECDLAIEAVPESADEAAGRKAIGDFRADLLAEHLGAEPERVRLEISRSGSLIEAIERLGGGGRRLVPLRSRGRGGIRSLAHNMLTDPTEPIGTRIPLFNRISAGREPTIIVAAGAAMLGALALLRWHRGKARRSG